ncbi:MAG TPA: RidA family protein [Clostridia bacterium]|nr:RidA family protein [Clostridia bacterium]
MQQPVISDKAPAAIGPYSQAVKVGNFVFTSGQLGIDPQTGNLEGDIKAQTRQALLNLQSVLEAAGSGLDRVVKTTVFLADINEFAAMNEVYAGFFKGVPPARSAVQAANLPKGARVEIEAVAVIG